MKSKLLGYSIHDILKADCDDVLEWAHRLDKSYIYDSEFNFDLIRESSLSNFYLESSYEKKLKWLKVAIILCRYLYYFRGDQENLGDKLSEFNLIVLGYETFGDDFREIEPLEKVMLFFTNMMKRNPWISHLSEKVLVSNYLISKVRIMRNCKTVIGFMKRLFDVNQNYIPAHFEVFFPLYEYLP